MKTAIVSVSDKKGVVPLVQFLIQNDFKVYSTGGTYSLLKDPKHGLQLEQDIINDRLKQISDLTGFPEILEGRVKTLHPTIYAGLLADRSNPIHQKDMSDLKLDHIDLVVCNLYPFIEKPSIETIDIGGVTLLRASSKNYKNVIVLSSPSQYPEFILKMSVYTKEVDMADSYVLGYDECERKGLAKCAFGFISKYDDEITRFLTKDQNSAELGEIYLKYGMNPHQKEAKIVFDPTCGPPFEILNGQLGMINVIDIIHGWLTVKEIDGVLDLPTAISMKHTSLAGLAVGNTITDNALAYYNLEPLDEENITPVSIAYMKSRLADPLSSFGDFICISREVDLATAKLIKMEITDGIAAPGYTPEALEILKGKKGGAFKIVKMSEEYYADKITSGWTEQKWIYGLIITQQHNFAVNKFEEIEDFDTRIDHVLANTALKYAQSNNISMAVNGQIIGMGCGQQNRVGCVKLAGEKANNWALRHNDSAISYWNELKGKGVKRQPRINQLYDLIENNRESLEYNYDVPILNEYPIVMASDGFFPFTDNIELGHSYGVKHVIHPGGSIADEEIEKKCKELDMKLTVIGTRMFYH